MRKYIYLALLLLVGCEFNNRKYLGTYTGIRPLSNYGYDRVIYTLEPKGILKVQYNRCDDDSDCGTSRISDGNWSVIDNNIINLEYEGYLSGQVSCNYEFLKIGLRPLVRATDNIRYCSNNLYERQE